MKKLCVILILVTLIFLLGGCGSQSDGGKEITSAMIRYFDGSGEQVILKNYWVGYSTVKLYTADGREITVSPYNVILIKETEDQYYGKE